MAFSACCSSLLDISQDYARSQYGGERNRQEDTLIIKEDLPALLLTELDGLGDEVLVVGELGSGEARGKLWTYLLTRRGRT
jgi:hypothetical protein